MTQVDIEKAVKQIAENVFEVDSKTVADRGHLIDDLGATSITKLEFLAELERRFDLQLNLEEIELAGTLNEVAEALGKRLLG